MGRRPLEGVRQPDLHPDSVGLVRRGRRRHTRLRAIDSYHDRAAQVGSPFPSRSVQNPGASLSGSPTGSRVLPNPQPRGVGLGGSGLASQTSRLALGAAPPTGPDGSLKHAVRPRHPVPSGRHRPSPPSRARQRHSAAAVGSVSLGRIVFTRHALPTVRLVNHVLPYGDIVVRVHDGPALLVTDPGEGARCRAMLRPWVATTMEQTIRVRPHVVTGIRLPVTWWGRRPPGSASGAGGCARPAPGVRRAGPPAGAIR
ncbi:hypothetical protein M2283_008373 [Streptomyces pseudovenezuelae]|uniref:Uncharacterized protein n=1 Tax=Streptomyces pseudovenezuelae TaxID=67350 RepID=A0ABT6LXJ9_9ACTN|nr:hypothetical protein [Streptomyces pseudovenezuelae]